MPPSYYVASGKYTDQFRRLEGNVRAEVCVIGGGYSGVATALALAEAGKHVVLVEQNQVGWGASGRNGGQVLGGFGPEQSEYEKYEKVYGAENAKRVWEEGIRCVELVKANVDKYNIDCDFTLGYFDAAMNQREMDDLKEAKEDLEELGFPHKLRLLDQNDVKTAIGSDRFIGGLVNEGWGHCHPLNLCRGEAKAAEGLGVEIYEDARVSKLDYHENHIVVDMDWGRVTADKVVLACNAYLGNLVPRLANRMLPVGSYIIGTERLSDELANDILPGNHAVCDQRWAVDYFRMSADKRLLFGGVASYTGVHPKNIVKKMRPKMLKVFPQLKDVKIDYQWGGYLAVGLNRIPQVGRIDERTYFAQAFAGHGVAPSHSAGRMIADAILGDDELLRIVESVKHRPFPGGRLFRKPILAAGMAFEQFKETLRL
ncbi:MAG: FAD-binding oxidoreductase [Kordiimonadaceae bacterium]|nr:FAD-binding oxidoreductase [Kordiimonadaceae bacterium]MBO6570627.1 FAD-binding oxidoreductase [Kordiimonadaceae bacterium]MBO6966515.1 FAD-binding oxidoreductase [Kordiimonadaceae bacterium]